MLESFSIGIQTIQTFARSLTGFALIIPALFWLLFVNGEKAKKSGADPFIMRCLAWLALLPLLGFTAPVSSGIIVRLTNGSGLAACYLSVPVVLITTYALTEAAVYFKICARSGRQKALIGLCAALAVLCCVSVPYRYLANGFDLTTNTMKIDSEVILISDLIKTDRTLMPSSIRTQIGEYEPDSQPAEGVRYYKTSPGSLARNAVKADCRYVVVQKQYDKPAVMARFGLTRFAETDRYFIYEREP